MTITFRDNVNIIYHLSFGVRRRVIIPFIYKETVTFAKKKLLMQISHEIFSRKFPSSLLIFRKRLFKKENLGDYFRNFMISPAQSSSLSLSLSSSLSSSSSSLGSLSNDDGENVTKKVNSRCFKLYRAYSISFNSSNVGIFSWS